MKLILTILFIVVWFSNYLVGVWAFPEFEDDYIIWGEFVSFKEIVYEIMLFIVLIASIFKPSREARALTVSTAIVVALSIVDKITGVLTYAYTDIIVVVFAVFVGLYVYRKNG